MQRGAIAVIGAGVIGSAVAYALAREGHEVTLLDRAAPGMGGASYGNVGHIAAELVEPLPSPALLFGFWRQLVVMGGPLDLPLRRVPGMLPWMARFASAAFRREENTKALAPLVRESRRTFERWLREIGRRELLRCTGHYEVWLRERGAESARARALAMERLGIPTEPMAVELLEPIERFAVARTKRAGSRRASRAAGLWFPDTGSVVDPLEVVRAFAHAAVAQGATVHQANVQALEATGQGLQIMAPDSSASAAQRTRHFDAAVVCTGAWSRDLLAPFGLNVPMQAARGYHIELPDHAALIDAPILYSEHSLIVTAMTGRLRASSYMEFATPDAPPDPRKPRLLREMVRALGYDCPSDGTSWVGSRPVLPDYLPGIGRLPAGAPNVFYAIGHQHIGLTLAAVTGDLVADLVAERTPRHDVSPFDLRRFA